MVLAGIVAGGTGMRFGGDMPKQFLEIGGVPIIIRTLSKFLDHKMIDGIVVGVNTDWLNYCKELITVKYPFCKRITVTAGGYDRNATINNIADAAIRDLGAKDGDILVTHDAVRPFVTSQMIENNIETAKKYGICTAAISATDTLAHSDGGGIISDLPLRSEMYQVQTPQSFRIGDFKNIYRSMTAEELEGITDVCKLFLIRGQEVRLTAGDVSNIKITYPLDVLIAEQIITASMSSASKAAGDLQSPR